MTFTNWVRYINCWIFHFIKLQILRSPFLVDQFWLKIVKPDGWSHYKIIMEVLGIQMIFYYGLKPSSPTVIVNFYKGIFSFGTHFMNIFTSMQFSIDGIIFVMQFFLLFNLMPNVEKERNRKKVSHINSNELSSENRGAHAVWGKNRNHGIITSRCLKSMHNFII